MAHRFTTATFSAAGFVLAVLAAGVLAAGTTPPSSDPHAGHRASSGRECFFLREVSGFNNAGKDQIYVHTGPRETYLFRTLGPCPDLDFGENIGFDQVGGGSICNGIDVDLIVPSPIGPRRCPVAMIRKLAPGEKAVHRR
jgi:hypothetical protein